MITNRLGALASTLPGGLRARPWIVFLLTVAFSYGTGMWMQLIHTAEGGYERDEPPLLLHWLRDSTLSLPLVFLGIWVAVALTRRLVERRGVLVAGQGLGVVTCACCTALAASLAAAVGGPLHAGLFGAAHGGHEMPFALHMLRDGLIALAVNLPIGLVAVAALASRSPWRAPARTAWRAPVSIPGRLLVQGALGLMLTAPVVIFAASGVQSATAAPSTAGVCPDNAPVKRFDVRAIDVDIPLNRFGDHDPLGKMYVLADRVDEVRAQERSRRVTIGLRNDPIQPLVIRANLGDCVEIDFTNDATGGDYGTHIDGLSFAAGASGDAVGENPSSAVPRGASRTYRYYIPENKQLEGTHYMRPGPGSRAAVSHGLFGALAVQPKGSKYLDPRTSQPLRSGWEAMIVPGEGPAYREDVKIYHEVGDEKYKIPDGQGDELPVVDPITTAYRPGSRAINYRSEPFMHRLQRSDDQKSLSYNSYTFGDPATPFDRGYLSDPTKLRVLHAGSETFHVYHLHGGGIRWRFNPAEDTSSWYGKVGLDKKPKDGSASRLDSQSMGPGESFSLEIEGGAGGVQQTVGDLLEHCHIAEHYVAGMWSFWRVHNTRQPDLAPLPDRAAPPTAVDAAGLIGRTMADGTKITKDNLEDWVRPMLPTPGVPRNRLDAEVWDWRIDRNDPENPVILGEQEEDEDWPNLPRVVDGHPSAQPGDQFVGNRPKILFNPLDGRPAYPMLRPNIGQRAPHAPNGHSGTPFLGGDANAAATPGTPNPLAGRRDGLCPANARTRRFDVTTIQLPIPVTGAARDATGKIFVLNKDKDDVLAGRKPAEPLALRGHAGDCIDLTLSTELEPEAGGALPRSNMHIHHLQFDVQGSDGASAGMVFDQSILPYRRVDPQLTAAVSAGQRTLPLTDVAKFPERGWIAIGLAEETIEIHQIASIDAAAQTVTLTKPLKHDHAEGEGAGTEFVQYRWYPDVQLDNIFWHDHVDGIHGWGKGLVGQFIVEPDGSTFHDPKTGEEVDSGTIVDIRTPGGANTGPFPSSFREMALWTINDNPVTDATVNLRAAPWSERLAQDADPSLLFSSYRHGDPNTPLPRAYRGDPFVIRTINVSGNGIDSLRLDGHRFRTENRIVGPDGKPMANLTDALHYGVSERFSAVLEGGAGGEGNRAGDYLYHNGTGRRFRQGAWGIMRVLPRQVGDLQPLPGTTVAGGSSRLPTQTGGRPPESATAGEPCPTGIPSRSFDVSAVDVGAGDEGATLAFVRDAQAQDVMAGRVRPEPLVLHAAAGECLEVKFTNQRKAGPEGSAPRASFHVAELDRTSESSGVNVGYNPESTVAAGETRTYRYHVQNDAIGSAVIGDFGGNDTGTRGLYGAVVVAPKGAEFADARTGLPRDFGTQVDVRLPDGGGYRDYSLLFSDDDAVIGGNTMPYPDAVAGPALVNYRSAPRADSPAMFSSRTNGDPATPILTAYPGDPMRIHAIGAPGSEQGHVFSLGGLAWRSDGKLAAGAIVTAQGFAAWETIDIAPLGGAGGWSRSTGDMWWGDLRRPFNEAGMWGLMRTISDRSCPIRPLPGRDCVGEGPLHEQEPGSSDGSGGTGGSGSGGSDGAGGGESKQVLTPRAPSVSPSTPKQATGGSRRADPVLRDLVVPRQATRGQLARGVRVTARTSTSTRTVVVELRTRDGRRVIGTARAGVRGGAATVTLKLPARVARGLRTGRYVVELRAGDARLSGRLTVR
jgi:FtsP/CotA-like multicopper oxidase with cupredoxin domain